MSSPCACESYIFCSCSTAVAKDGPQNTAQDALWESSIFGELSTNQHPPHYALQPPRWLWEGLCSGNLHREFRAHPNPHHCPLGSQLTRNTRFFVWNSPNAPPRELQLSHSQPPRSSAMRPAVTSMCFQCQLTSSQAGGFECKRDTVPGRSRKSASW